MATTWSSTGNRSAKAVSTSTGGTATGDAPTLATDGVNLTGIGGVAIQVSADSGKKLAGAGTLQCYVYDADTLGVWVRVPDLDQTIGVTNLRGQSFPGIYVPSPRGRVAWIPSGVTVDAGSVTVWINCTSFDGRAV